MLSEKIGKDGLNPRQASTPTPTPYFSTLQQTTHPALSNSTPQYMETLAPNKWDFCCNLEVDYSSEEVASMVYAALAVDKELQPDKVKRHMSISNGKLSVRFEAVEARFLRASYSAFVDVLTLATKTIEEFGQGLMQ
ncbi:transcription factor [Perilla frutescens var. hirtella]|nr:transcription factor [Perilla frutescens var. hirtella]